jgi:steroid 5-alpha reductase family enzyme
MARWSASRTASFAWILVAYAAATALAVWLGARLLQGHPWWMAVGAADVVATVVVFAFSVALDNSSVYDPYWSVAPVVIALGTVQTTSGALLARKAVVLALVTLWGVRLTFNWARGWQGLGHEDWRYADLRRTGKTYWVVSFVGFHMMPTGWVYLGSLALLPALSSPAPLSVVDAAALVITLGAIVLESVADQQLRAFRLANKTPGRILDTGVWSLCRHPNYLGEVGFWWGLYLFAIATDRHDAWMIVGPASITLLFVFVSIPMIDRRSVARRPDYSAHMTRVPALIPRLSRPRPRKS